MPRARKALIGIASSVLLAVAAVYGWLGDISFFAFGVALLTGLASVGLLLSTQSLATLRIPHPYIWLPFGLAACLHLYEHRPQGSESFSFGWFGWALAPYFLALALSCFRATRVPAVAGAVAALLMDALTFHSVFIAPTSSTAPLAIIWTPAWNILIFVPGATWVAWLINRRRQLANRAEGIGRP